MQLILASSSEGRKKLLSLLKIPFRVIPSNLDEEKIIGKTPLETLQLRAKLKGENVATRIKNSFKNMQNNFLKTATCPQCRANFLILAADSGAILNNQLIGKPKNYQEAAKMLRAFSAKTHEFVTCVYLIKIIGNQKKVWQTYDRSFITFRQLTEKDIKTYLSLTEYTKYAGAYALFASPQDFIVKIEGSLSNVIGLPLEKVMPRLKKFIGN